MTLQQVRGQELLVLLHLVPKTWKMGCGKSICQSPGVPWIPVGHVLPSQHSTALLLTAPPGTKAHPGAASPPVSHGAEGTDVLSKGGLAQASDLGQLRDQLITELKRGDVLSHVAVRGMLCLGTCFCLCILAAPITCARQRWSNEGLLDKGRDRMGLSPLSPQPLLRAEGDGTGSGRESSSILCATQGP